MKEVAGLYEVFSLVSCFYLIVAYLCPTTIWNAQVTFFSDPGHGGHILFAKTYFYVIQILPVRFIMVIFYVAISALECKASRLYKIGGLIVSLIETISLLIAIRGILRFLHRFKNQARLIDSQVFSKLICFKGIVILSAVQGLVISICNKAGALDGTEHISHND